MSEEAVPLTPALDESKQLRMPVFRPGEKSAAEKIADLEDYMLLIAFVAGKLAEERIDAYARLEHAQKRWRELRGWEGNMRGKTNEARDDAKRRFDPDLADARDRELFIIARLSEEIERFHREDATVSRAYTFIMGG